MLLLLMLVLYFFNLILLQESHFSDCLNYDQEKNRFKFEKQTTPCTEHFEWLDSNAIRHIKSNKCINQYGLGTHNCYSFTSAYVKVKNGQLVRVSSNCMGQAKDGRITTRSCETAPEIIFNWGKSYYDIRFHLLI